MRRKNAIITNLLLLVIVLGCQSMKEDEWYTPPPNVREYKEVEKEIFFIKDDHMREAVLMLQNETILEIDDKTFLYLTGNEKRAEKRMFLLRALAYTNNRKGFAVFENNNSLFIWHGSLSDSKKRYRYAIILCLDKIPESIFVSCNNAR